MQIFEELQERGLLAQFTDADLIREIDLPLTSDFMAISSYGSATKTSGVVRLLKDLDKDIVGKDVIIVEDIVDTGVTAVQLRKTLLQHNPKSVKMVSLLYKPASLKQGEAPEYVGFNIPSRFILGYGLDIDGMARNLPDIYVLKEDK